MSDLATDRIQTTNTSLSTAQSICKSIRYGAIAIASISIVSAYFAVKSDNRAIGFIGCIISVFSLSTIAPSEAISKELGERLDSIEVFRIDGDLKYSEGYDRGSEDVENQLTIEHKAKLQKITAKHDEIVTGLKNQIESQELKIQQLSETVKKLKPIANKLSAINQKQAHLAAIEQQIRTENDSLTQVKLNLADERARYDLLREQLLNKDSTIFELQSKIEQLVIESQSKISDVFDSAYSQGVNDSEKNWSIERERLQLVIARYESKLKNQSVSESVENRLQPLEKFVQDECKPFIITASQGGGKALTAATIAGIYAGHTPLMVYTLDISEGGSNDSTWHKLCIPNTHDAREYLQFMIQLCEKLDPNSNELPFRNDRIAYDKAPTIVLLIDELVTVLSGLDSSEKKQFVECLRIFETRGSKRKVFVGLMTNDSQIQNLSGVVNSGNLRNYYKLYLNDGLLAKATDEILEKSPFLREYLETNEDKYIAAIEKQTAQGLVLNPFRHVSHHGQKLSEKTPKIIPSVTVSEPYQWFNLYTLTMFARYVTTQVTTQSPQVTTESPQSLESFNSKSSSECHPKLKIPYTTIDAVLDCKSRGLNQSQTILEVWGLPKKGNSPKWIEARDLFNAICKEYLA